VLPIIPICSSYFSKELYLIQPQICCIVIFSVSLQFFRSYLLFKINLELELLLKTNFFKKSYSIVGLFHSNILDLEKRITTTGTKFTTQQTTITEFKVYFCHNSKFSLLQ